MELYTITVTMPGEVEFEPWTRTFSTRQKAEDYRAELYEHIERVGLQNDLVVTMDSGRLDDGSYYLDAIDNWFEK